MIRSGNGVVKRTIPVFECFSDTIYHVGGRGTGIAMKLANNYVFAVNSAVVCEALVMARSARIDDETFFDITASASDDSYALRRNLEQFVLPEDYDPEAALSIVWKDMTLAEESVDPSRYPCRLGARRVRFTGWPRIEGSPPVISQH